MAEDYYQILGVSKTATPTDIQTAYRKLARKYHPDLNPDDKAAKTKFQQVQTAFETLNDEKKRKLYDQFGPNYEQIAAGGPGAGPRPGGGGNWSGQVPPGGFGGVDIEELLGQFGGGAGFGNVFDQLGGRGAKRGRRQTRQLETGADRTQDIIVPFKTAIAGGETELAIPRVNGSYETLKVKIPAGINDGGKIRLRGQGEISPNGGPPGDLLLTVRVASHPAFVRTGDDLEVKLPISLTEAIMGAKVDVPTPQGTVSLKIPAGTSSGKRLRVKGYGVKRKDQTPGDLYAIVQIVLPPEIPDKLAEVIALLPTGPDPRGDLKW
jgi:DnaJ-class molecular chaperone